MVIGIRGLHGKNSCWLWALCNCCINHSYVIVLWDIVYYSYPANPNFIMVKKENTYYVVEFRLPFLINEATPQLATQKASRICEAQFGFIPSAWYARIFEYQSGEENVGPVAEYFWNPNGKEIRKVDQNQKIHEELIKNE